LVIDSAQNPGDWAWNRQIHVVFALLIGIQVDDYVKHGDGHNGKEQDELGANPYANAIVGCVQEESLVVSVLDLYLDTDGRHAVVLNRLFLTVVLQELVFYTVLQL
jgi:hypothetical protein